MRILTYQGLPLGYEPPRYSIRRPDIASKSRDLGRKLTLSAPGLERLDVVSETWDHGWRSRRRKTGVHGQ